MSFCAEFISFLTLISLKEWSTPGLWFILKLYCKLISYERHVLTTKMVYLTQERKVVVLANLKPRNMRGVKSCGMLMAASDASHEKVELLEPPEGSLPGQRIWFGSENDHQNQPPPATPNQVVFTFPISKNTDASFLSLWYLKTIFEI